MALIETRSRRCRARRRSSVWPLLSILKQGWRDNLRAPGAELVFEVGAPVLRPPTPPGMLSGS